jgi:hypothetical protein
MKLRWLPLAGVVLLLAGCATDPGSALADQCQSEAELGKQRTDTQPVETVAATVEKTTERAVRDDVEAAVDVRGTTVVTYTSGTSAEFAWSCFAQRVEGKDFAAIQSFTAK